MLSVASTNCQPVPSDDIRGAIPLLTKEGSGVVGRYVPAAGRQASAPSPPRRGLLADRAIRRPRARPSRRVADCKKNTKIVGTNSTTLLKQATCNSWRRKRTQNELNLSAKYASQHHILMLFVTNSRRISLMSAISPSIILSQSALSSGLNSRP